jgi:hypothetical protein
VHVWTPAFHHQFLDGNPANFSAPPGVLTALPNGLVVQPTPPPDQRGYAIAPGHSISYTLERTFLDVIGIDIRLDVVVFGSAQDQLDVQVRLDGQAVRVIATFLGTLLRLQLFVGGTPMAASIPLDAASGLFRLHLRWHTHGQGSMWVNDVLRAYDPALQPGLSLPVTTLFLGHHSTIVTSDPPKMRARRLTVKVLRKDDATRLLDASANRARSRSTACSASPPSACAPVHPPPRAGFRSVQWLRQFDWRRLREAEAALRKAPFRKPEEFP